MRAAARVAYWSLYSWFAVACELTGHWDGCALLNRGPLRWAWRAFGHYGEYGFAPGRRPRPWRYPVGWDVPIYPVTTPLRDELVRRKLR